MSNKSKPFYQTFSIVLVNIGISMLYAINHHMIILGPGVSFTT